MAIFSAILFQVLYAYLFIKGTKMPLFLEIAHYIVYIRVNIGKYEYIPNYQIYF